jgi:hypothetical protein
MERVLGPEHPDTLQSRNNLEILYNDKLGNEKRGWIREFLGSFFRA